MKKHLFIIFIILFIFCVKSSYSSVISKIIDAQMKKMGWTNYNHTDLDFCIKKFEINTKERISYFISILAAESALGRYNIELTNCSIYDNRRDLGNIQPGDGCKYKGVGYLVLSGRTLYQQFSDFMGDKNIMEGFLYVAPRYSFSICGFMWNKYNINHLIDKGTTIQKICNWFDGGIGSRCMREVNKYFRKAKDIF